MDYPLSILIVFISFVLVAICVLLLFSRSFKARVQFAVVVFFSGVIVNVLLLLFNNSGSVSHLDSVLHAFYDALLMFLGNSTIEPMDNAPTITANIPLRILQVIKWGLCIFALSITASAVASVIGSQIYSYLQVLVKDPDEICVFYGYSEESKTLAGDLKRNKPLSERLVVFISKGLHESHVGDDIGKGTEITEGIPVFASARFILRQARNKKLKIFLFDENNEGFIDEVYQLIEQLRGDETETGIGVGTGAKPFRELELFIFAKQDWMRELMETESGLRNMARIIDISQLRARHLTDLIQNSDAVEAARNGGARNGGGPVYPSNVLLIGGLGHTGQEVLRQIVMNGQYPGCRLTIDVVDVQKNDRLGAFKARYPSYGMVCDLQFHAFDVASEEFYDLLASGEFNYLIVSLGDERASIKAALDINNWYLSCGKTEPLTAVCVDSLSGAQGLRLRENLHFFGADKEILTERIVIDEKLDDRARKVNGYYSLPPEKRDDPAKLQAEWSTLSFWHRESSRASADYYPTMKALAARFDATDLALAQAEHQRWNAFHCMNGFRTMSIPEMRERFTQAQKLLRTQDVEAWGRYARQDTEGSKRHICLVDWDELDKVSAAYNSLPDDPGYLVENSEFDGELAPETQSVPETQSAPKAQSVPTLKTRDFKAADFDVIELTKALMEDEVAAGAGAAGAAKNYRE